MRLRAWGLTFAAVLLIATGACAEDTDQDVGDPVDDEAEASMTVDLMAFDFRYDTETISVEPDTVVQLNFTNSGAAAHSFTAPDLDVEIEVEGGDSASVNFAVPETPGAYEFFCKFHPDDMTGSIAVGGEGVPPGSENDEDDVNDPDDTTDEDDAEVDVEVEEDTST